MSVPGHLQKNSETIRSSTVRSSKDKTSPASRHSPINKSSGGVDSPGIRNLDFVETFYQDPAFNVSGTAESLPFVDGQRNQKFVNPTYRTSERLLQIFNKTVTYFEKSQKKDANVVAPRTSQRSKSIEQIESSSFDKNNSIFGGYSNQVTPKQTKETMKSHEEIRTIQSHSDQTHHVLFTLNPLENYHNDLVGGFSSQATPKRSKETPKTNKETVKTQEALRPIQSHSDQRNQVLFTLSPLESTQPSHSDKIMQSGGKNAKEDGTNRRLLPQFMDAGNPQVYTRSASKQTPEKAVLEKETSIFHLNQESFTTHQKVATILRELEPEKFSPTNTNKRPKYEYKPKVKKPKKSPKFMSYEEQQTKRAALQQMLEENIQMLSEKEAQYKGKLNEDLSKLIETKHKIKLSHNPKRNKNEDYQNVWVPPERRVDRPHQSTEVNIDSHLLFLSSYNKLA